MATGRLRTLPVPALGPRPADAGGRVRLSYGTTPRGRPVGVRAGRRPRLPLGGDEFAELRVAPVEPCGLVAEAASLAAAIAEPMRVAGRVLRVSAAIGLAMATAAVSLRDALSRADMAMYQAKRSDGFPVLWSPALLAGPGGDAAGGPLSCLSQPAEVAGRLALGAWTGASMGRLLVRCQRDGR